jgi:transposase
MLRWILIVGGLLIMIVGQHDRSEALFCYFRLEDQVPETHLLRLIEKHISFAFVREKLKQSYSETGRSPSPPAATADCPTSAFFRTKKFTPCISTCA